MSRLEGHRLKITVWLIKVKPCKWLRRAFKRCFYVSYNNILSGFLGDRSKFQCAASDTFKILSYSEPYLLKLFKHVQAYSTLFMYINAYWGIVKEYSGIFMHI